jgi:hypothetical protein
MTSLFDNQPVKGLRPDGKIERRGRPKLTDEQGHELCSMCRQPKNIPLFIASTIATELNKTLEAIETALDAKDAKHPQYESDDYDEGYARALYEAVEIVRGHKSPTGTTKT